MIYIYAPVDVFGMIITAYHFIIVVQRFCSMSEGKHQSLSKRPERQESGEPGANGVHVSRQLSRFHFGERTDADVVVG